MPYKSFDEINQKIREGKAVVVTAGEIKEMVAEKGPEQAAREVDVVTTATFGPMCSSGAFLNFGHSEPPIRMSKVWLNDVPAYAGVAAVDAFIGATELSETKGFEYGGAHVIQDLVAGKKVKLRAESYGTDCYPRKEIETWISKETLNQAYLFNPRNAYQNYGAATNSSDRVLHTYMGTLLPGYGNVNYSTTGELSPLLNDPYYRTIGIGTRVFLCGAQGYVAWQGTQHNPLRERAKNGVPIGSAGTLALIGDLKEMDPRFLRAATFPGYGVTLFVGVGIPIPVLDEDMAFFLGVRDEDIYTNVYDYAVPSRSRPALARVSYRELRSGAIYLNGRRVRTAPLSSVRIAREIAALLKDWIASGRFLLQQPIEPLPTSTRFKTLDLDGPVATDEAGGAREPAGREVVAASCGVGLEEHGICGAEPGLPWAECEARAAERGMRGARPGVLGSEDEGANPIGPACVDCGACTAVCPTGALTISSPDWTLAYRPEACNRCGLCVEACPVRAIDRGLLSISAPNAAEPECESRAVAKSGSWAGVGDAASAEVGATAKKASGAAENSGARR